MTRLLPSLALAFAVVAAGAAAGPTFAHDAGSFAEAPPAAPHQR